MIERDTRLYMLANSMFEEIPVKKPYYKDPTGKKQVRDYHQMLQVLNHILCRLTWRELGCSLLTRSSKCTCVDRFSSACWYGWCAHECRFRLANGYCQRPQLLLGSGSQQSPQESPECMGQIPLGKKFHVSPTNTLLNLPS